MAYSRLEATGHSSVWSSCCSLRHPYLFTSIYSTDLWRLQDFIGICSSSFVDCYKRISHIHAPIPSVKDPAYSKYLLERNETGRVGGTNTGSSVLDWVAVGTLALSLLRPNLLPEREYVLRDREFSQVVSDHLRLDFDLVELLS